MRKNSQTKGIFCLEGLWDSDLRRKSTIRPILELLTNNMGIPFIHRNCATIPELEYYLIKWPQKKYDGYPILYLAFHGEEAGIDLGGKTYSLDKLARKLNDKCQNKIIILGSCSTLNIDKRHVTRFLKDTKALAICGYKIDVDWMQSTAFELLLLNEMQSNEFSGRGIDAIEGRILEISKSFKQLDFRIVTQKEVA